MPSVFKKLFQQSFAYAVGTVLNRATNIILVPLYVRHLSKAEYGMLEILLLTSTLTMIVLQLGMGSALMRSVLYKGGGNRQEISSTAHSFLSLFSFTVIVLLMFFSPQLSELLFSSREGTALLRVLFLGDLFLVGATIPMSLMRIDQKVKLFVQISAANFILGVGFTFLFLVYLKRGVMGVLWANTITAGLFALFYLYVNRQEWRPKFSWSELRDMLGFGLPLVPSAMGDLVLQASDRYIIKAYHGFEQLGAYSVGMRLSMVIALAVNAFQMAWPAIFFPMVKDPRANRQFARIFTYYVFAMLGMIVAMALFSHEIILLFATAGYLEAAQFLPLLSLSFLFYGMYYYTSIGLQVEKKTWISALVLLLAAGLNVFLNLALIPGWGLMGAGVAKLLSFMFLGLTIAWISQRYYAIAYEYGRLAKLALLVAAAFAASLLIRGLTLEAFLLRLLTLLLLPVLLLLMRFFPHGDLQRLQGLWAQRFRGRRDASGH